MSLFGSPQPTGPSLFGNTAPNQQQQQQQQQQQPSSSSLFGAPNAGANTGSNLFAGLGSTIAQQGAQAKPTGSNIFGNLGGNANQQQQPATGSGIFGSTGTNAQQQGGGGSLFANLGNPQQQQQQNQSGGSGNLFANLGNPQQQQQPGGGTNIFAGLGSALPKPNAASNLFTGLGNTQQNQQQNQQQTGSSNIFAGLGQQNKPQTGTGLFGSTQNQAQPSGGNSLFGGSVLGGNTQQQQQQQNQQQQPQLGATLGSTQLGQTQGLGSTIWTPFQGMTGVHRSVPMQIMIVNDKWNPYNRTSPFRTYLYNNVGEDTAPFYQPGPNDDETKWEEALRKRPGPSYVPILVQGFMELGKRAQRQRDFLTMMQVRLHEINNALTEMLQKHNLQISIKIAACRRRHLVLSQRTLALAAKTEVLRNRGYAMDETEVELQHKLQELERKVFDPLVTGRVEEIWARMMTLRERSKKLQQELEQLGDEKSKVGEAINEATLKTAKKILEDYSKQIQFLANELNSVQKQFENMQKTSS